MSKSLGNFVDPEEVINKNGAEILRLWVAMLNYKEDARFGGETVSRIVEAYRKIRNTWRFMLGNIHDFDPDTETVSLEEMSCLDKWILEKAKRMGQKIEKGYIDYEYHTVFHSVYNFFTVELSSYYLDVLKDRLYCSGKKSIPRRSAQTALFLLLKMSLLWMAPLLPFTAEEGWEFTPDFGEKQESVHLHLFPSQDEKWLEPAAFHEWEELGDVRDAVLKELETARENKIIGNSLEASVALKVPADKEPLLRKYERELASLFIVSQVILDPYEGGDLAVEVTNAPGEKCARCWNFSSYVGQSEDFPRYCKRCEDVVRQMRS
jgi:isoleucyl-tRNA synthetase